jgi:steroid 5-alpha reductase family enzyme
VYGMSEFLLYSGVFIVLYMSVIFCVALIKKDNSIVDIAWGLGFIGVALLTFFLKEGYTTRHLVVSGLVLIWGMRLALHIAIRKRGKGEDYRYAKWRKDWGRWFVLRSYFQIFMLQGVFLYIISIPIILVHFSPREHFTLVDFLGVGVWCIGFIFEAVGDFQLKKFKKDPANKGKIITTGLWKYTRHPNYFGEVVMWWGIFLLALSVDNGWMAILSPLTISFLLLRVSGVTMLEKKYKGNPEFEAYAQRTNAFFPWFPKDSGNRQTS